MLFKNTQAAFVIDAIEVLANIPFYHKERGASLTNILANGSVTIVYAHAACSIGIRVLVIRRLKNCAKFTIQHEVN